MISVSNRTPKSYQYQVDADKIKQRFPQADKGGVKNPSGKAAQRDVLELSGSDRFEAEDYSMDVEEIEKLRYKVNHTIIHEQFWFSAEAGKELQKIKEEKGAYTGSDLLNAYGYTYARLYDEIEQRHENSEEQWFGLGGVPLTKEMEIEELNRAYDNAVEWMATCAKMFAEMETRKFALPHWEGFDTGAAEPEASETEKIKSEKEDLEALKDAFRQSRDRYMDLYRECRRTGKSLTMQNTLLGHSSLLALLAKKWSE